MSQAQIDPTERGDPDLPTATTDTRDRRPPQLAIAAGVGLVWLSVALEGGPLTFLLALPPGGLMLSGALASLVVRGDPRPRYLAALGALIGIVLGLPLLFVAGLGIGLMLLLLAFVAFAAEGWISQRLTPEHADVPPASPSIGYAAQIATDDALLAWMLQSLNTSSSADHPRIAREIHDARALFEARSWLAEPVRYHEAPPPPEDAVLSASSFAGVDYGHLRYPSGYEPRAEEPGRERWLDRRANRTAHAFILQHEGPPRPWLVCIHGYQMGVPWLDFPAFDVKALHRKRGVNVALPVLPLHGPRKPGRVSGEHFISADFLDTVHAAAQAMWDIRRLLHWIRAQGGETIGVYGLSLGGYNTSLLAGLDAGLACAIAGIPATDFARLVWRHGSAHDLLGAERAGVERSAVEDVLSVVSPLALEPLVAQDRRLIFGAIGDQLVPADQVRDLWQHWDRPEIAWYPGAHLSFMLHRHVGRSVDRMLKEAGLQA